MQHFWSDNLAREIKERKSYRYMDKEIPKLKEYTIKTSASLSGVLHIGRLSDTIRSESVHLSLRDLGLKSRFIWVAEDMDPLRGVPKGVPKNYKKYVGLPVTDVPDPWGCHKSYAQHFLADYFKVVSRFVKSRMKKYSMREEYKKGSFKPYIKSLLENMPIVLEIQNKYRKEKLTGEWSPWKPICKNCGKIITTRVTDIQDGVVTYLCEDYNFAKFKAKGCGYKGTNDPMKGEGKLLWKSEWASQWALWKVVAEGAGKEYQVPGSAFWVNSEICEKVLDFPAPVPIFYEHLLIDGVKMSASLGNVIYPKDWVEVAEPDILRYFYNKRLMKTRSFSWTELPNLYDDFDLSERVYFKKEKIGKHEDKQFKRLYEISRSKLPKRLPPQVPYSFAAVVSQIYPTWKTRLKALKETGQIKGRLSSNESKYLKQRLEHSKMWVTKYAPEEQRFELVEKPKVQLVEKTRQAVMDLAELLKKKKLSEKELYNSFYEICEQRGVQTKVFFSSVYKILINKPFGPRLAPFILAIGKNKVVKLLEKATRRR